ncbi:hypothetical protein [Streptomyces sp. SH5]|uniref:hypothetical protein n=1 Tax=Streptomyces sp. SH5 TaxID=3041765 RepID=UPI002478043C|nr:hypothetical protein [Streptomyces sp. SH5]WGP10931.1 hypothetical protein QFA72_15200 [Streptomyces sp. SH5]
MSDGLPSRQTVNAVGGRLRAREIAVGTRLWTLHGHRAVQTTVTDVTAVKVRTAVEVATSHAAFTVSGDLLLATPGGWIRAEDAAGRTIAWTHARKLCRERLTFRMGYAFGYVVGATCADGTVGKNYVSLVVNDEAFATRYARCLTEATGLEARLQPVVRPSGYLGRDLPGFRVRVVSSYLADALRQYAGGDAHHMRQAFPRVVLRDREVFDGFLDGYADGDGCRAKHWAGRTLVSANVPFLVDLAEIIGARFTPARNGLASHLVVVDRWAARGTFRPEHHDADPVESSWVTVESVRPRPAPGKPFTLYGYRLKPHPTFLVNGHLVRVAA